VIVCNFNAVKNILQSLLCMDCFFNDSGWAIKRGFITARAGRPDTYRAANHLLRMTLSGKICLALRPLGFTANKSININFKIFKKYLLIVGPSLNIHFLKKLKVLCKYT